MSGDSQPRRPDAAPGSRTAGEGTPVPVDVSRDVRSRFVWLEFLAGPLIWFAHFMVVYLVAEAGCTGSGVGLAVFAPPVPTVVTLAATAVAVAACLWAGLWAYRRARVRAGAPSDGGSGGASRLGHEIDPGGALAYAGFLLSALSAVTVLFVGLPALVLPAC